MLPNCQAGRRWSSPSACGSSRRSDTIKHARFSPFRRASAELEEDAEAAARVIPVDVVGVADEAAGAAFEATVGGQIDGAGGVRLPAAGRAADGARLAGAG